MTPKDELLTYRFQWVVDMCWESDPTKKGVDSGEVVLDKSPISKVYVSLHQPIAGPPTAGSLPCDHTRLWNLNVSGRLNCKATSPMALTIEASLDQGAYAYNSVDKWLTAIQEILDGKISKVSVSDRIQEILEIEKSFRMEAQKFIDSIAWCTSARSATRIVKPGWLSIDKIDDTKERYFDIPSQTRHEFWKRSSIDVSQYTTKSSAPFSSIMLGEAWEVLSTSDRTASVLGYISAESAVKECFSEIIQGGNWLVEDVQSPPLPNLLQSMLKHLNNELVDELCDENIWGKSSSNKEWCAAASWLQKRANERNKIVHGKHVEINVTSVVQWLELYERLLTLLWLAKAYHRNIPHELEKTLFDKARA